MIENKKYKVGFSLRFVHLLLAIFLFRYSPVFIENVHRPIRFLFFLNSNEKRRFVRAFMQNEANSTTRYFCVVFKYNTCKLQVRKKKGADITKSAVEVLLFQLG